MAVLLRIIAPPCALVDRRQFRPLTVPRRAALNVASNNNMLG
jgi:hypothetical protein